AMLEAAKNGLLPKQMAKVNKYNVPTNIVLIQGIIVSIWAVVLTLGGGGANLSFFVAMALTVCIYLVAYVLLFISYIKLVKEKKDLARSYQIPGGKKVKIGVAIIGLLVSVFAFFISFFPPNDIGYGKGGTYLAILIISWLIILVIPFGIYKTFDEKGNNRKI
ncbi:amino acid permease, partial [Enterococcus hirae]